MENSRFKTLNEVLPINTNVHAIKTRIPQKFSKNQEINDSTIYICNCGFSTEELPRSKFSELAWEKITNHINDNIE